MDAIPLIDIGPLFGPDNGARRSADSKLMAAARDVGFVVVSGLPKEVPLGAAVRAELFRIFDLPQRDLRRLWRNAWAPENPNVYRGIFPIAGGVIKHGYDIGPEQQGDSDGDALAESTPLPAEEALPGWRRRMREYFAALSVVGDAMMRSLARGFAMPETGFDEAFRGGNSTMRLIMYPPWPGIAQNHGLGLRPVSTGDGQRRYDIGGEHVDSGFVTLLQQDSLGGLQARIRGDTWVEIPPLEQTLVVNFGKLLERWTGGRIRATEHRVLGNDRERRSAPFFHEPRIAARIAPLPIDGVERFEPFLYGDHLWDAMTQFSEFADARRWPANRETDASN